MKKNTEETILSMDNLFTKDKKEIALSIANKNCAMKRLLTDFILGAELSEEQIDFIYEVNQLILQQYSVHGSEPDLSIALISSGKLSIDQLTNLQYALETEDLGHQKTGYYKKRMHCLRDNLFLSANSIAQLLDNRELSITRDKRMELEEEYEANIVLFNKIISYLRKSKH